MSSPPPVTTPPGSNVTPMWGAWGGRPPPQPPGCFSQLYGLNQCYDDIKMMEQILQKVICDMAANNPAFQQCLAEAIAASGSNVPRLGVTNGTEPQAGQVGEFIEFFNALSLPLGTLQSQTFTAGVLQPGQWLVWSMAAPASQTDVLLVNLNPIPAGFSNGLNGGIFFSGSAGEGLVLTTVQARANITVPTLLAFTLLSSSTAVQSCAFYTWALRIN